MATLRADRRLYVTADRSEIVEETDPRGAFLLAAEGRNIGEGDVALYRLSMSDGRVVYPALKQAAPPENKMMPKPEDKAASADEAGGEWPLKMSPETYLDRRPDGPNAGLAKRLTAEG